MLIKDGATVLVFGPRAINSNRCCCCCFFFPSTKIYVISYKLRIFLKPRLCDSPLLLISGPSAKLSLSLAIIQGAFAAENMKNLPLALYYFALVNKFELDL